MPRYYYVHTQSAFSKREKKLLKSEASKFLTGYNVPYRINVTFKEG
jgi:hypothetical protein